MVRPRRNRPSSATAWMAVASGSPSATGKAVFIARISRRRGRRHVRVREDDPNRPVVDGLADDQSSRPTASYHRADSRFSCRLLAKRAGLGARVDLGLTHPLCASLGSADPDQLSRPTRRHPPPTRAHPRSAATTCSARCLSSYTTVRGPRTRWPTCWNSLRSAGSASAELAGRPESDRSRPANEPVAVTGRPPVPSAGRPMPQSRGAGSIWPSAPTGWSSPP